MKKLHAWITKVEPPNWVLAIIAVVTLFRIPSLFQPYYYGDEMIYVTLGNAIRKGVTLYSQIHDNKPPLIYILGAVASNLFWFKVILLYWMIVTIIIFWHLSKTLFENNKLAQKVSVIIFAILTTIPLLEGQIVNAELFLIGPVILALVILLKKPTRINLFISGLLFSISFLFKVPAVFDMGVIVIYWLITTKTPKDLIKILERTVVLCIGFAIPIILTIVWFYFHNAASDYIKAAFLQNIGYISSWNGGPQTSFVVKHGPLLMRAGIVLIGIIALRIFQSKVSKTFLLTSIWLLTSLFAATLSERPYPHYLIQAVPAISILVAILIASAKKEQVFTVIPLTLAILVPVYFKFWYYPTLPYYTNFVKFVSGNESKNDYLQSFDKYTLNNYATASFIVKMTTPSDKVFIWGEEAPTVYALTRRLPPIKYVANYHINDYSSLPETAQSLTKNPPTLIVLLPDSPNFPEITSLLRSKYILINNNQSSSQIWHLVAK